MSALTPEQLAEIDARVAAILAGAASFHAIADRADEPEGTQDRLLTYEEVAAKLGLGAKNGKDTVREWANAGVIPVAMREGKLVRFDWPAVKAALAKRADDNLVAI